MPPPRPYPPARSSRHPASLFVLVLRSEDLETKKRLNHGEHGEHGERHDFLSTRLVFHPRLASPALPSMLAAVAKNRFKRFSARRFWPTLIVAFFLRVLGVLRGSVLSLCDSGHAASSSVRRLR